MSTGKFGDITPKRKQASNSVDAFIDGADNYQNQAPTNSKEPTERLNVEVPRSMHKAIKIKAVHEDCHIKDIVINAINEYLNK